MGCQLFHSGLTSNQSRDIENIQKRTLKIILGKVYTNYEEACTLRCVTKSKNEVSERAL